MDFNHFKPCLLIAMPELADPNFEQAVVLLTDYKPEGAVGFVLNRPSTLTLGKSITLTEGMINQNYDNVGLWRGGPVEPGHIWMIYNAMDISDEILSNFIPLGEGVAMAKDLSLLVNHEITVNPSCFRVMHGYSGWNQDQLNMELANSFWITAPIFSDLIFDVPADNIWKTAIRRLGIEPGNLVGTPATFLN